MRAFYLSLAAAAIVGLTAPALAQSGKTSRLTLRTDVSAQGNAQGTPQRDPTPPRGLAAAFARGVPGILNAIQRTVGSNSRLQDLPVSP